MPKYKVLAPSFIDNRIVNVDEIVDYDGIPAANLQPVDKAGEKVGAGQPTGELAQFIGALRMHAASRGVPPDDVNEFDFDEVLKARDPKPSSDVVKAAASFLKVTLGQSLA
jgi:hypothetical protein